MTMVIHTSSLANEKVYQIFDFETTILEWTDRRKKKIRVIKSDEKRMLGVNPGLKNILRHPVLRKDGSTECACGIPSVPFFMAN